MEDIREEFCNLHCGECIHFKVDADRTGSTCPRLDHRTVKFATSPFKSYDCGQFDSNRRCMAFEPNPATCPKLSEMWKGYDDYWGQDANDLKQTVSLIINNDTDTHYAVRAVDFADGKFQNHDGSLRWVYKVSQRRSAKSPTGYTLVKEYSKEFIWNSGWIPPEE